MKNYVVLGDYNAICDICGFKYKASQLKKNWKGLMVCDADFETRHPQDLIRVRPERSGVSWSRPEQTDTEVLLCYIWSNSAYAGLATAGCSQAGPSILSYQYLINIRDGT